MRTLLRRVLAIIALMAFAVTLLPPSALAEARTSFVRPQIDSRPAKLYSEAAKGIEIVPHKTENPMRSEIWDGSIATSFAGGSGTEEDPLLISNGSELAYLAQEVNGDYSFSGLYIKLTNDIYLNDTSNWENWGDGVIPQNEWTAIGGYNEDEELAFSFDGYFDGDGYAVRGIYINSQEDAFKGLFGYIGGESIVANLGVTESYICGYSYVGGVVGMNVDGTVTNCYNTGSISGEEGIGGVVGFNYGGTVTDCHNAGSISGNYSGIGGVVGANTADVINCYNIGSVTCEYSAGGVVGENVGTVTDCYNDGNVNGEESIGGVVGINTSFYDDELDVYYTATVTDCYNTGNITGSVDSYDVGGVVGQNDGSTVTDCYNTGSITGNCEVGGAVGSNYSFYDDELDIYYNATVTNCYNTGSVTGNNYVGGVVGWNDDATVSNCHSTGNVTGIWDVGGVVGQNDDGTVIGCYNTGSITGGVDSCEIGGVVGWNDIGTVTDCYNTGNVTGEAGIGGVAGANESYYDDELDVYYNATITNCYNTGNVTGHYSIGGVVGANDGSTVTNCYYFVDCCTSDDSNGTALTDEQMQASDSFIGFDFVEVWTMDGNPEYPYPELIGNEHGGMATVTPGDANGDGIVTIADATLVARMALNLTESVPAADFNGDGNIAMADATLTARKALNLI